MGTFRVGIKVEIKVRIKIMQYVCIWYTFINLFHYNGTECVLVQIHYIVNFKHEYSTVSDTNIMHCFELVSSATDYNYLNVGKIICSIEMT